MYENAAGKLHNHARSPYVTMDKSIERIIRRALEEAREKGRDHLTQTELAVKARYKARRSTC